MSMNQRLARKYCLCLEQYAQPTLPSIGSNDITSFGGTVGLGQTSHKVTRRLLPGSLPGRTGLSGTLGDLRITVFKSILDVLPLDTSNNSLQHYAHGAQAAAKPCKHPDWLVPEPRQTTDQQQPFKQRRAVSSKEIEGKGKVTMTSCLSWREGQCPRKRIRSSGGMSQLTIPGLSVNVSR